MKIAILGGGVGGLSCAIALAMEGYKVEVFERNSEINQIGAGIVCWPNACFVLDKLGVLDQVTAVSGQLTRMNRVAESGQSLGSLDIDKLSELMGYPSCSILRKDLMAILDRRVKELDIKIHYNFTVSGISPDPSGYAIVHFANGTQIQPEIILSADGRMNSYGRRFVNGENAPVYQGFINWIAHFESDKPIFADPTDLSVSDYWGVGSRFGIVPVTDRKAYWAGGVSSAEIGPNIPENYKSELRALFPDWSEIITTVIEQTPTTQINKIYVHDHNPIDVWHKDNVLLIGDAAHAALPTSGQGACQALEDAWQISQYLSQRAQRSQGLEGDDLETVFKEFTAHRSSKANGIIMVGRNLASSIFNTDPEFCQKRNASSISANYDEAAVAMARGWSEGLLS